MKSSYVFLLVCLLGVGLISCNNEEPPTTQNNKTNVPHKLDNIPSEAVPVQLAITGCGERVTPDRVTVKTADKQIEYPSSQIARLEKGLVPGKYHLEIHKKGYELHEVELEVTKGVSNVTVTASLKPMYREVVFEKTIPWDSLSVDGEIWGEAKGKLEPGRHKIEARKLAYQPYLKEIDIPAGESPYAIPVELTPEPRALLVRLNYGAASPKSTPEITLSQGQKKFTVNPSDKVLPGTYTLKIRCAGFQDFEKEITMNPGTTPHTEDVSLKEFLQRFQVTVLASGQQAQADAILLNDKPIHSSDNIACGNYMLKVIKSGYQTWTGPVVVTTEGEFAHTVHLQPLPRQVLLVFQDAETAQTLLPEVWLGQTRYSPNCELVPGSYQLKASLAGFHTLEAEIAIPSGEGVYSQKFTMKASVQGCEVVLELKAHAMADPTTLIHKVATLGGQDIKRGTIFPFGKHQLVVEVPGYKRIEKEIEIPVTRKPYIITERLEPLAIRLEVNIFLDYPMGNITPPYRVTIDGREFTGDITPGPHKIEVYKIGYETLTEHVYISEGLSPQDFTRYMVALPRPVRLVFVDAATKEEVAPDEVRFRDKIKLEERRIDVKNIFEQKPGIYEMEVSAKDYEKLYQDLEIEPGEGLVDKVIPLQKK